MRKFFTYLKAMLSSFMVNQAGSAMVMLALSMVPLITVVAIGVDVSRAYMVKSRLSSALDAASLAGGRAFYMDHRDQDIHMLFDANFPSGYLDASLSNLTIDVNTNDEILYLKRSATIPTTFMKLVNINEITVSSEAEIHRRKNALDVVLAIDMSGSMSYSASGGGTRIEAARDAANILVDVLFGSETTKDLLQIGLVPWNSKVNVQLDGEAFDPALTISEPVPAFTNPITGAVQSEIYRANNTPVPFLHEPDSEWKGCVYSRFINDANSATNADIFDGPISTVAGIRDCWLPEGLLL
ncbi:MAG: Tad domain-containing protein, partial [Alphaproteobacteria bacterium]|nr:Tad domain-containing protein [Alphaproteobacteria bacterium]